MKTNRSPAILVIGLLALALVANSHAQPPATPSIPPAPVDGGNLPGGVPPPAPASMQTDPLLRRDSPRRLLETFYFCLEGVDFRPEMIQNAAACLDSSLLTEGTATLDLIALHLGELLNRLVVPLIAAPESAPTGEVVLVNQNDCRIVMRRGPDGLWQFSPETVRQVPEMRRNLKATGRPDIADRQMVESMRSPEATFRAFRQAVARNDFMAASTFLDSTGSSSQMWDIKGPQLARELAFVIQRLGFVYCAELPNESGGTTHCWRVVPAGQVTLERVSLPDARLAWKFSRATLHGLSGITSWLRTQKVEPDPRWKRLDIVLDSSVLKEVGAKADRDAKRFSAKSTPAKVVDFNPAEGRETTRSAIITFLKLCEEFRVNPDVRDNLHASMDLAPLEDQLGRKIPGTKAAIMLDAIIRAMEIDINILSDIPNDEPQTLRGQPDLSLTLRRMKDGAWRFDQETLLRLHEMYNRLTPALRGARERQLDYLSARESYATFTWALFKEEIGHAVDALDMSEIQAAARSTMGPILAWKIRYVLDRYKYIIPQVVPGQPDGRRWLVVRTPEGDTIQMGRRMEDPWKDRWLFSPDSLKSIDTLFKRAIDEPPVPEVANSFWYREGPDFLECPSVWMHLRVPPKLRQKHFILADWQWLGIAVSLLVSWLAGLVVMVGVRLALRPMLRHWRIGVPEKLMAKRTRPIQLLTCYGSMLMLISLLDLPLAFMGGFLPVTITGWLILAFWTGYNLLDLCLEIYIGRPTQEERASLRDLMAPTLTLVMKAVLVLFFGYWLISLLGDPDLLTRILAGMGIVGLAVSLAAQDAIKHFFGTLLLISEGPFKIGDRIVIDKFKGVVELVGFRSTRIRTDKGTLLVLPNSVLAGGTVENLGRRNRHYGRLTLTLLELPGTDCLARLKERVTLLCQEMMPGMKSTPKIELVMAEGEAPPCIRVRTWLPGWGGQQAQTARSTLMASLAQAALEQGLVPLVDTPAPWRVGAKSRAA